MKFESKFNVGDIVKTVHDSHGEKLILAYKIMEIWVQNCYTTTQIFYDCCSFVAHKKYKDHDFKEENDFEWLIERRMGNQERALGWNRVREDEVISLSKEEAKVFKINN